MRTFTKIPQGDAAKVLWLSNFANKLPQYAGKYEISAADVLDMQQSYAHFAFWLDFNNQLEELKNKTTPILAQVCGKALCGCVLVLWQMSI